ncbi:MAG TPA: hypothetical protein VK666_22235 [Chryseolinea sp.]|nr:hypothetical protein [Chryseolinea sp.]
MQTLYLFLKFSFWNVQNLVNIELYKVWIYSFYEFKVGGRGTVIEIVDRQ